MYRFIYSNAAFPDYITLNRKFHIEGGMENWGAVTTSEDSVFYNNRMSILEKRRALNMGHEFSHFWFGDLCRFCLLLNSDTCNKVILQ